MREYERERLLLHVIKRREGVRVCVRKKEIEREAWKYINVKEREHGVRRSCVKAAHEALDVVPSCF